MDDAPLTHDPLAQMERAFIAEFLAARGHTLDSLHTLPPDRASALMKAASLYASGKLTEVESRAHLISDLHGDAAPPRHGHGS
jgi:hypothetical protein